MALKVAPAGAATSKSSRRLRTTSRRLLARTPTLRLLALLATFWAVAAGCWFGGPPSFNRLVERLATKDIVAGPALQVAVEQDRLCAFLGNLDGVKTLNANNTALAAEHVLLLVKAVSADLATGFEERYDLGLLNITAPADVGGAAGQPFAGSWLWAPEPYWALMPHWFFAIFSLGVVSPKTYQQDVVLVPGPCPGPQPSLKGYYEVTVTELWDDSVAWQLESGADADGCPGLRSAALFRAISPPFSSLEEISCAPDADAGVINMGSHPWTTSSDTNLIGIVWYSVALALFGAALFAVWVWRTARHLIQEDRNFLHYMLAGFQDYGWCQLSDGSMLVHVPWRFAEEKLREVLRQSYEVADALSGDGGTPRMRSLGRMVNTLALADDQSEEDRAGKVEGWLSSVQERWPCNGLFVLSQVTEPYTQRSVATLAYNGSENSNLAIYRAILGLYHERDILDPVDPVHALATLLKPVPWDAGDPPRAQPPSAVPDEEAGGSPAPPAPLPSPFSERQPFVTRRPTAGEPTRATYVSHSRRQAAAGGATRPQTFASHPVRPASTEQLMGVWLLVERLTHSVLEAFTSRCWEPSYKTDNHAGKEGSVEAAAGGTSGDGNDNDDDDGATPEEPLGCKQRGSSGDAAMNGEDDDTEDGTKDGKLKCLTESSNLHLGVAVTAVHTLAWCTLAALWMPGLVGFRILTWDAQSDEEVVLPVLLLVPSLAILVLALVDLACHESVLPANAASSAVRRAQHALLFCTVLFVSWYGIAVLLWLLLALLLRGTAALPAVLMVAGGLAVVLRQRARAQEGRHLIRMPLDKSLELCGLADAADEGDGEEEPGSDDDDSGAAGGEGDGGEEGADGDANGSEAMGSSRRRFRVTENGAGDLSLRANAMDIRTLVREGVERNKRWKRRRAEQQTMPATSNLIFLYGSIAFVFACLVAFVILGAVALGVGGAEVFAFLAIMASVAADFFAQTQYRRLLRRAQRRVRPTAVVVDQVVRAAARDAVRKPTVEEEENLVDRVLTDYMGQTTMRRTRSSSRRRSAPGPLPGIPGYTYPRPKPQPSRRNDSRRLDNLPGLPEIRRLLETQQQKGRMALAAMEKRLREMLLKRDPKHEEPTTEDPVPILPEQNTDNNAAERFAVLKKIEGAVDQLLVLANDAPINGSNVERSDKSKSNTDTDSGSGDGNSPVAKPDKHSDDDEIHRDHWDTEHIVGTILQELRELRLHTNGINKGAVDNGESEVPAMLIDVQAKLDGVSGDLAILLQRGGTEPEHPKEYQFFSSESSSELRAELAIIQQDVREGTRTVSERLDIDRVELEARHAKLLEAMSELREQASDRASHAVPEPQPHSDVAALIASMSESVTSELRTVQAVLGALLQQPRGPGPSTETADGAALPLTSLEVGLQGLRTAVEVLHSEWRLSHDAASSETTSLLKQQQELMMSVQTAFESLAARVATVAVPQDPSSATEHRSIDDVSRLETSLETLQTLVQSLGVDLRRLVTDVKTPGMTSNATPPTEPTNANVDGLQPSMRAEVVSLLEVIETLKVEYLEPIRKDTAVASAAAAGNEQQQQRVSSLLETMTLSIAKLSTGSGDKPPPNGAVSLEGDAAGVTEAAEKTLASVREAVEAGLRDMVSQLRLLGSRPSLAGDSLPADGAAVGQQIAAALEASPLLASILKAVGGAATVSDVDKVGAQVRALAGGDRAAPGENAATMLMQLPQLLEEKLTRVTSELSGAVTQSVSQSAAGVSQAVGEMGERLEGSQSRAAARAEAAAATTAELLKLLHMTLKRELALVVDALQAGTTGMSKALGEIGEQMEGGQSRAAARAEAAAGATAESLKQLQMTFKGELAMVVDALQASKRDMRELQSDLYTAISKAVNDGISWHANISPALFKNKALWPFAKPAMENLPKRGDTLAEAFIRILRIYLTPYNFAPINQPPGGSRPTGSAVRERRAAAADVREAVTPRTGDEPGAWSRGGRPRSAQPIEQRRRGGRQDSEDAGGRQAWQE